MEKGLDVSKTVVNLDASSLSYTLTNLTSNTVYSIEMKAVTRVGPGFSTFADIKSGVTPGKTHKLKLRQLTVEITYGEHVNYTK